MTNLEKTIQKELSRMDHELFLDKELHPVYGILFYSVKKLLPEQEPLTVVEWRAGSTPLPLSMDIVSQVRAQEGDIRESIAQATANNAARKELLRQKKAAEQEAVVEEWQKSGRSTGIPKDSYMIVPRDIPSSD